MLLTFLAVVVLAIVSFLIFVATRPADFRISRSARIPAPASSVFAEVNDFHNWPAWSPWAKMDPTAKISYSGAASGEGAVYSWDGNNKVGAGIMTLTKSRPSEHILLDLEFLRPFKATHIVEFTFVPEGDLTRVTCAMAGKNSFVAKAITLFMDCDKMIGSQYEEGLANLTALVAATPVSR